VIYPQQQLKARNHEVVGFFFNPNIHPYQEYRKRLGTLGEYSQRTELEVIYRDEYLLEEFLRAVSHRVGERCAVCYGIRLEATASEAKERGFTHFSSTLLYSVYQKHELIRETGEAIARERGVAFYYEDFRPGWRQGVEASKSMGLYRQQYCGCIYSEKERYMKKPKAGGSK
jgi:epoxyqueuosine reductase